jgi:hypothetical protein
VIVTLYASTYIAYLVHLTRNHFPRRNSFRILSAGHKKPPVNMTSALYFAQLEAGSPSLRQKINYRSVKTEFLAQSYSLYSFFLRFSRVRITLPFLRSFQRYTICFNMLFTCDILNIVLGLLCSNVVIFLICLPCVRLANATVLISTTTMLNCKSNSVFRIQTKALITLKVFYLITISKRIVQFKKTKRTGM